MKNAMDCYYANPSAGHKLGQECRGALEQARRTFAEALSCKPTELIFTGSATEANLMALWGHFLSRAKENSENKKILISPTEHASVFENAKYIEEKTCAEVVFTPLTSEGLIDLDATEKLLAEGGFAICSAIAANNETGIIQPWTELAEICEKAKVPFHTDLVQYVGRLPIVLDQTKASTATISFHKSGGPKGVGLLYVKEGVQIEPVMRGGSQEKKQRSGTENIIPILGAAALAKEFTELNEIYKNQVQPLRDQFEKELKAAIPSIEIVGSKLNRIANTSYIIFSNIKSDAFLMSLDLNNIFVSTGSACSSGMLLPSRNLLALGYSKEQAVSALRFSLGSQNKKEEISKVIHAIQETILKLAA
jgi:cysteine desulfurase